MLLVLFNPQIGHYQVLPLRARVDLGAMAMKGYSAFPKAPALLEPHHQIVQCHIQDTHSGESVYSTAPADWARTRLGYVGLQYRHTCMHKSNFMALYAAFYNIVLSSMHYKTMNIPVTEGCVKIPTSWPFFAERQLNFHFIFILFYALLLWQHYSVTIQQSGPRSNGNEL